MGDLACRTHQGAPLLDDLGAVIDHVAAFPTGGLDNIENLVTACNKCNSQKSSATAAKWGEHRPRKFVKGAYCEPVHWDGLSKLFVLLAHRDSNGLSMSEQKWLAAIIDVGRARALDVRFSIRGGLLGVEFEPCNFPDRIQTLDVR